MGLTIMSKRQARDPADGANEGVGMPVTRKRQQATSSQPATDGADDSAQAPGPEHEDLGELELEGDNLNEDIMHIDADDDVTEIMNTPSRAGASPRLGAKKPSPPGKSTSKSQDILSSLQQTLTK